MQKMPLQLDKNDLNYTNGRLLAKTVPILGTPKCPHINIPRILHSLFVLQFRIFFYLAGGFYNMLAIFPSNTLLNVGLRYFRKYPFLRHSSHFHATNAKLMHLSIPFRGKLFGSRRERANRCICPISMHFIWIFCWSALIWSKLSRRLCQRQTISILYYWHGPENAVS